MRNTRAAGVSDISFESFLSNSAGFHWETQEMLIRHEKVEQQKVDPALKDVIRGNNRKEAPFFMKKGLLPSAYKSAAVRHMECTHYLHQSFMLSGNRPTKKSTKEKTSMEEADRPKSMYYYIFPLSVYIGKRR